MKIRIGDIVTLKDDESVQEVIRGEKAEVVKLLRDDYIGVVFFLKDATIFHRLTPDSCKRLGLSEAYVGKYYASCYTRYVAGVENKLSFWDNSDRDPLRPDDSPWKWL